MACKIICDRHLSLLVHWKITHMSCKKITVVSACPQAVVEMEDFRRAQPDGVARSSAKIISRLKAGGEKTIEALKSLCCRCKGIQVEVNTGTCT